MIHHQKILFIFCLLIFHLSSVNTENFNNLKLIFEIGGEKITLVNFSHFDFVPNFKR